MRDRDGTPQDFGRLVQMVEELAAAQVRTEQRLEQLAAAQARTEGQVGQLALAVEALAEAQRRTEEQLAELAARTEELAAAQARTEQAVEYTARSVRELTEGLDRMRKQVGGLSESLGGDIEDIGYTVLYDVLKREFGWKVGLLERSWETWDGEPEEVDLFGLATDPAQPLKDIWIVGEAKHNLTVKEVQRFAKKVERARQHLIGEVFPVCFCYRARPEVQQAVKDAGLRLVFSYGKIV